MFLGLLALIVQTGCRTTPKSSHAVYGRGPASVASYPLNPRFEQKRANEEELIANVRAVSFSLQRPPPSSGKFTKPLNKGPNEPSEELTRHVDNDSKMSCFEFQVQFLEPNKMTHTGQPMPNSYWIENALVEWPESQSPFYTVGRMTLTPKSITTPEVCEQWHIDVIGSNNEMRHGLGSINRAQRGRSTQRGRLPSQVNTPPLSRSPSSVSERAFLFPPFVESSLG